MGAQQLGGKPVLQDALRDRQTDKEAPPAKPSVLAYSLTSGAVALVVGALASLTGSTATGRVAVWCAVTCATSLASGLVYDSATVASLWSSLRHWTQGPSGP